MAIPHCPNPECEYAKAESARFFHRHGYSVMSQFFDEMESFEPTGLTPLSIAVLLCGTTRKLLEKRALSLDLIEKVPFRWVSSFSPRRGPADKVSHNFQYGINLSKALMNWAYRRRGSPCGLAILSLFWYLPRRSNKRRPLMRFLFCFLTLLAQPAFAKEPLPDWMAEYGVRNSPFEAFFSRSQAESQAPISRAAVDKLLKRQYDAGLMGLPAAMSSSQVQQHLSKELAQLEASLLQLSGQSGKDRNRYILAVIDKLLTAKIEGHPETLLLFSMGGIHGYEWHLKAPAAVRSQMGFVHFPNLPIWQTVGVKSAREAVELVSPGMTEPWRRMVRKSASEHFSFNVAMALEWAQLEGSFPREPETPPTKIPAAFFFLEDHLIDSTDHLVNFSKASELHTLGYRQIVAVIEGLPQGQKYSPTEAMSALRKADTALLEAALPELARQNNLSQSKFEEAQRLLKKVRASVNPQVTAFLELLERLEKGGLPVTLFSVN